DEDEGYVVAPAGQSRGFERGLEVVHAPEVPGEEHDEAPREPVLLGEGVRLSFGERRDQLAARPVVYDVYARAVADLRGHDLAHAFAEHDDAVGAPEGETVEEVQGAREGTPGPERPQNHAHVRV